MQTCFFLNFLNKLEFLPKLLKNIITFIIINNFIFKTNYIINNNNI